MPAFVTASNVRAYANITGINEPWSEATLGSNIRAASAFLQRKTGRQFDPQTATTKTFTTNGEAFVAIPDLRTATSVSLSSSTLTANTTYWLIPDAQQSGVYVGIQFRPFNRSAGYRAFPDWFDTNKDAWWWNVYSSEPNDLSITGDWGWSPLPDELLHATKALALWLTKRPDASLGNTIQTPEGNIFDLSALPVEVKTFIETWKVGESVIST